MTPTLHSAEAVAAEIVRRLTLKTVAQGAETNLGKTVYAGRRHVDESMLPCATIIEGADVIGKVRTQIEYEVTQQYMLFAYLECDPAHPNNVAHAAIRDMKRAMFVTNGVADSRWGGLVPNVEYRGRDIGPRADGAAFVVAGIEIAVTYVERLGAL